MVVESMVENLRGRLSREPGLELAILFGSGARGTLRKDSDLDLAVRWKDSVSRQQREDGFLPLMGDLSVLAGRTVQLVDLDSAPAGLRRNVFQTGRTLLDLDPARTRALHVRSLLEYIDWEYAHRVIDQSLDRRLGVRGGGPRG